jgi:alpha-galactosidase
MERPAADVLVREGALDLAWPGVTSVTGILARCRLTDGSEYRSDGWSPSGERVVTTCGPLAVALDVHSENGRVHARPTVTATAPVELAALELIGHLQIEGTEALWVAYSGYQSWDDAGHLQAGTRDSGALARIESWWTVGIGGDGGHGLAAAATSAMTSCTRFTVRAGEFVACWREASGYVPTPPVCTLAPGDGWTGDPVLLAGGKDVRSLLDDLAAGGPEPPTSPVPQGWLSWYHFGPWISAADVLANARALAEAGGGAVGYRLIQVDDGWQEAYGDWVPNSKFGADLAGLCGELHALGFEVGIWTAPFLVSASSDLAARAPEEWFVLDPETGRRYVDPRHTHLGRMEVLDGTHPGVREYLRETFARLRAAGLRYFKLDFLYAGAHAGLAGLRQGMEAIRAGAGDDAYLLASGAPLLPVAGMVQGSRIGPDTATPFYDVESGQSRPTIWGGEVAAVGRNLGARSFLRSWFHLDPDVALVGGNLSLEQGRQLVTMALLSGGPFFASDDLVRLPVDRKELLLNPEALELVGGAPAVPDWEPELGDRPPTIWRRDDVLAIFNWSDERRLVMVSAEGARGARDLWARRDLDGFGDGCQVAVPAHGVRLLRLRRS